MKAEIVSIGDEMTSGQRLDTNSQWLSQRLAELGIATQRHTTVADDLTDNVEVFRSASNRTDVIIATGGLGPTLDDLTREALAEAFGLQLELDTASLAHIESIFARRSRPMPQRNRVQAMLPQGSMVIPNPHGTAPGIDLIVTRLDGSRCRIFALPGVPAEMKQMWDESVAPRLLQHSGLKVEPLRYHAIKVFGIGESDVEARLPDLIRRDRVPRVGITVSQATISLRIATQACDDAQLKDRIASTVAEIETALGSLIFGSGDDELEDAVARLLRERELALATLEIGPGNLVGHWMLRASQSAPEVFQGALAFANLEAAEKFFQNATKALSTSSQSLEDRYSQVAQRVRETMNADIGLAFGPYPNIAAVAAGPPLAASSITFAVAFKGRSIRCKTIALGGHPDVIFDRIAKTALDAVRLRLGTSAHAAAD